MSNVEKATIGVRLSRVSSKGSRAHKSFEHSREPLLYPVTI